MPILPALLQDCQQHACHLRPTVGLGCEEQDCHMRSKRAQRLDLGSMCTTGVRYPAHLLPLVVATLTSMQSLMPAQHQSKEPLTAAELSGGITLQAEALKAAAMGAGGALRTEAVSPIDKKSLTKAFRWVLNTSW